MIEQVLAAFGINNDLVTIRTITQGLINKTWRIESPHNAYVLQKINHEVFKNPWDIAHNISAIAAHLKAHHPSYNFVYPIPAVDGEELIHLPGAGYFRLFPFVENSHTVDTVESEDQAYEAAAQFGRFTSLLSDFDDIRNIRQSIPSFHNLSLRYQQFLEAVKGVNKVRSNYSRDVVSYLKSKSSIVEEYEKIRKDAAFVLRVTHHDTKISNVLFNDNNKGLCVIDLDTVMPGYFFSDVGDMMRTYLSPVSEEEQDLSKIEVRETFYDAIRDGYLSEMGKILSEKEKKYFDFSGIFLVYMQALRFITDYLNNDIYYSTSYPDHNLMRAKNQVCLLEKMLGLRAYSISR